ncbi:MAG: Bacitracin resistance protein BacA [Solirubrobacterales bacterium]|jgi:hypothetical protein|nr:Bacitracin resistance protein BacA [Solirubrobacterales bacterium]
MDTVQAIAIEHQFRTLELVGGALIAFSFAMLAALALVPGVSGSGATISAGLFLGLAARSAIS